MFSSKIKPIIEKLDDEFKKIQIKKRHNLLTVTPRLGMAFIKNRNNNNRNNNNKNNSNFRYKSESKSCLEY